MADCSFCGTPETPLNPLRTHLYLPTFGGCVIIVNPPPLPPCTCPFDPVTKRFARDPNCPRHQ